MEQRYCSYCGNRLEPNARFCSSCGRPVHRAESEPTPEPDEPTSRMPTSPPPSPPPQQQPRWAETQGGTRWYREGEARGGPGLPRMAEARGGVPWPMLALAGVFLILVVAETVQGGMSEAVRAVSLVAAVVLVASVVSYLSLGRRGEASLGRAFFNWSVVVLAAFATILFLIS